MITKLIFEEKSLNSEYIENGGMECMNYRGNLYVLFLSELALEENIPVTISFDYEDKALTIFNKGNNINDLTDVDLLELLDDNSPVEGNVLVFNCEKDEISQLENMYKKAKNVYFINFLIGDKEVLNQRIQSGLYKSFEGDDYVNDVMIENHQKITNKEKTKERLSEILQDIAKENGLSRLAMLLTPAEVEKIIEKKHEDVNIEGIKNIVSHKIEKG